MYCFLLKNCDISISKRFLIVVIVLGCLKNRRNLTSMGYIQTKKKTVPDTVSTLNSGLILSPVFGLRFKIFPVPVLVVPD
jgi:hypothetical protein